VRGLPSAKKRQARAEKGSKARTHRHSPRQEKSTAGPWRQESHRGPAMQQERVVSCVRSHNVVDHSCARHTVHGQSSPTACVWSDELIAQRACYWVTESHQVAPPAETPTASKPHQREKRQTTNKPLTTVRELSTYRVADRQLGTLLFKVVPRPVCAWCAVRCNWHRMQRLPFA
jgi:hypothetical protein